MEVFTWAANPSANLTGCVVSEPLLTYQSLSKFGRFDLEDLTNPENPAFFGFVFGFGFSLKDFVFHLLGWA